MTDVLDVFCVCACFDVPDFDRANRFGPLVAVAVDCLADVLGFCADDLLVLFGFGGGVGCFGGQFGALAVVFDCAAAAGGGGDVDLGRKNDLNRFDSWLSALGVCADFRLSLMLLDEALLME